MDPLTTRSWRLSSVLAFVLVLLPLSTARASTHRIGAPEAGRTGTWSVTGSLATARTHHTATLLPNGEVLVAGGCSSVNGTDKCNSSAILAGAELYNPRTGTWSATGSMTTPRADYTATLLPSGRVLVAGGQSVTGTLASAELYTPATGTWAATEPMTTARSGQTATLLPNGIVLVVGGDCCSTAELYNPHTGTWTTTSPYLSGVRVVSATLLKSGQVLVTGAKYGPGLSFAELYETSTGTWTRTGAPPTANGGPSGSPVSNFTATLLRTGRVLIAGGTYPVYCTVDCYGPYAFVTAQAALYDPQTGTWAITDSLHNERFGHTATLLPSGSVMVSGGLDCPQGIGGVGGGLCNAVSGAEVYDPDTGTWAPTGSLRPARFDHTATVLSDGHVLVAGGADIFGNALASAEVFNSGKGANASLSTTSLTFSSQLGGTSSAAQTISVTNTGVGVLTIRGVAIAGASPSDFTDTTTCTRAALAPGDSCAVEVRFTPQAVGPLSATVHIMDNAPTNPQNVVVSGYGTGPNAWTSANTMSTPRFNHTATLLPTGNVLVAGGQSSTTAPSTLASAEIYDSHSGAWMATKSMITARELHTATLLPNGKVLVAGGQNSTGGVLASAELYDPNTATWAATGAMTAARYDHTATLLSNGRLLVAGGCCDSSGNALASAELYNPSSDTWVAAGAMTTARQLHTATLLPDGRVLVTGGFSACCHALTSAELYDPATGTWAATGSMITARYQHTATLLPTGQVLVAGGSAAGSLASAELYDPSTGTWTATSSLSAARYVYTATLLPTGKVLVAGGCCDASGYALSNAELYDPSMGTWADALNMSTGRQSHTATLLPTGNVLSAGGNISCCAVTASAELYTPALLAARPAAGTVGQHVMLTGHNFFAAEPVQVYWDVTTTAPLATLLTSDTGAFAGRVTIPPATAGPHTLIAVAQHSHATATAHFTVTP